MHSAQIAPVWSVLVAIAALVGSVVVARYRRSVPREVLAPQPDITVS
jgi:hypothetical protein